MISFLQRELEIVYNPVVIGNAVDINAHAQSQLYRAILDRIISGEYAAGARLVEEDLARSYEVSRTPIREVLFALERDGLIERVRNQGARVVSFTPDDVEEVFDVRSALECFSLAKAVQSVKLNELLDLERQLGAAIDRPASGARTERLAELDMRLHRLIVHGSSNRRLISYMERVALLLQSLQLAGYRNEEHVRQSAREHLAIVQAMLRRDVLTAQQLLADHIEGGKRHALERFLARCSAAV